MFQIPEWVDQLTLNFKDCYIAIIYNGGSYELELETVPLARSNVVFPIKSSKFRVAAYTAVKLAKELEKRGILVHYTRESWENERIKEDQIPQMFIG